MAQRKQTIQTEIGSFDVTLYLNVSYDFDREEERYQVMCGVPQVDLKSRDVMIRGKQHHVEFEYRFIDGEWITYTRRIAFRQKGYHDIYVTDNNGTDASRRLVTEILNQEVKKISLGIYDTLRKESLQEGIDSCLAHLERLKEDFRKDSEKTNSKLKVICNLLSKES